MTKKSLLLAFSILLSANIFLFSGQAGAKENMPYIDVPINYNGPDIACRFGLYLSPSHHMYADGWHTFTTMVNKRTKGKVDVKEYLGGVLFKAKEGFKAVRSNICDVTPAYPNYAPTGFKLALAAGLPFMWENAYVATRVLEELYPKYFKKEYEKLGCKILCMSATSNYQLFTNKPITKLEQLKGMKVRSGGGLANKVLQRYGMVPVVVPSPEIYTAMQRGMVDACIFSWGSANSYKLYEVSKFVTEIGPGLFSFAPTSAIINPRWLKKLPPDLKKIVYGAARETGVYTANTYEVQTARSMKAFQEHGVKIVKLPPEEVKRWKDAAQPVVDKWIEDMESQGLPAKQMLKDMEALNNKYKNYTFEQILELQKTNPVPMDKMW